MSVNTSTILLFLVLSLTSLSFYPYQAAQANLWSDISQAIENKIPDVETAIREALAISEDVAITLAIQIGYDFSKNYFENYDKLSSEDIDFKRVLLAVILHHDLERYLQILAENPILAQLEIENQAQKIEKNKAELKQRYTIFGNYDEEAWSTIKNGVETKVLLKQVKQPGLEELDKQRSIEEEVGITILKALPSYDYEEGKLTTLNQTTTKLVSKIPELEGSDVAKDPIRTSALIVSDPEFIMYANIIETEEGQWISMEEALMYNYKAEDVQRAELILKTIDFTMDIKKIENPNHKAEEFFEIIEEINDEKESIEFTK